MKETEEILQEGVWFVELYKEKHLIPEQQPYHYYFPKGGKQLELLQQMLPLVSRLPDKDVPSEEIAGFFIELSEAVHPRNTAIVYLNQLKELRKKFNQEELPTTQNEFETKANIYRILH